MIVHPIPRQAKFLPSDTKFTAAFNIPFVGGYDFNTAANQNVKVLELVPNSVYYVDNLSVGANIPKEDYLGAILITPLLTFKHSIGNEIIYSRSFPIVQLYEQKEATVFFNSQKTGDFLSLSLTGQLNQTAELVGKDPIALDVSLSIYQISERDYKEWFDSKGNTKL